MVYWSSKHISTEAQNIVEDMVEVHKQKVWTVL